MYAFAVCEPRVVTVVSCVLKASYFIHRDFTDMVLSTRALGVNSRMPPTGPKRKLFFVSRG